MTNYTVTLTTSTGRTVEWSGEARTQYRAEQAAGWVFADTRTPGETVVAVNTIETPAATGSAA
jgi:hypothetical protein